MSGVSQQPSFSLKLGFTQVSDSERLLEQRERELEEVLKIDRGRFSIGDS